MTRFFTTDTLGGWLVTDPAQKWAREREAPREEETVMLWGAKVERRSVLEEFSPDHGWRSKLVSGLDCPYCVGTWVGFAAIGSYLIARRRPATLAVWRFLAAGLGMNYVVGHVSSRID